MFGPGATPAYTLSYRVLSSIKVRALQQLIGLTSAFPRPTCAPSMDMTATLEEGGSIRVAPAAQLPHILEKRTLQEMRV